VILADRRADSLQSSNKLSHVRVARIAVSLFEGSIDFQIERMKETRRRADSFPAIPATVLFLRRNDEHHHRGERQAGNFLCRQFAISDLAEQHFKAAFNCCCNGQGRQISPKSVIRRLLTERELISSVPEKAIY